MPTNSGFEMCAYSVGVVRCESPVNVAPLLSIRENGVNLEDVWGGADMLYDVCVVFVVDLLPI